ncbi:acetyl-CoA carboxylase carboxyltransferase component [Mycobacterium sp. URHB0021]
MVLSYDYTVLAGTQGALGHGKKDRLFELIDRMCLPTVFFAEGGGGRPGDTDYPAVSALDARAFKLWAALSGLVPRIAIVKGRCFPGNAVIAGCSDLIVATEDASIGMGGPAMIAGGGLGDVHPDDVGPIAVQAPNGVVDVVVADEAQAVATTKRLLAYFQGPIAPGQAIDQTRLRTMVRERPARLRRHAGHRDARRRRVGDVAAPAFRPRDGDSAVADRGQGGRRDRQRHAVHRRCDHRRRSRQGRPVPATLRRVRVAGGLVGGLSGLHGGPRGGGRGSGAPRVAHAGRRGRAGAPLVAVVLRRGYGLGAQAMVGGSLHEPVLTVAWPGAHLGPMGLEGAVRLGLRKQLAAIADDGEREERVRQATAAAQENAKALNAAQLFEIDDVIDPADTRGLIAATLAAATAAAPQCSPMRFVDTW